MNAALFGFLENICDSVKYSYKSNNAIELESKLNYKFSDLLITFIFIFNSKSSIFYSSSIGKSNDLWRIE